MLTKAKKDSQGNLEETSFEMNLGSITLMKPTPSEVLPKEPVLDSKSQLLKEKIL
jgi:hypothetical protein